MSRPRILPGLLAHLLSSAPARLRKRLDETPTLADAWPWKAVDGQWRVQVDAETTVTFTMDTTVDITANRGRIAELSQVSCTCLLSPRCLHILACLNRLELDEDAELPTPETAPATPVSAVALQPAQREVAELALVAIGRLLGCGIRAAGAVVQADLLRTVHHARTLGCHRLATALTKSVVGVKRMRSNDAATSSAELIDDVRMAGTAAREILSPTATTAQLGTARRIYGPLGNLRLHGLVSEPILTRSGYAGIVTWLIDAQGRRWSLSDVQPGGSERIPGAWAGGVNLGDLSLSHRELVRSGVILQDATGSVDGRLGAGASVRAVRAAGSAWNEPPLAVLFQRPLAEQIHTAWTAANQPEDLRNHGDLLLLTTGQIEGADADAVRFRSMDGLLLRLVPVVWNSALPAVDNLRTLAGAVGLSVRIVARMIPESSGSASLLAIGVGSDGVLALPTALAGRVMMGLEHLPRSGILPAAFTATSAATPAVAAIAPRPWSVLERRLQGMLLGGRATCLPGLAPTIALEAITMQRQLCPAAAQRLLALYQSAQATGGRWGRIIQQPPEQLAASWLAAAIHASEAQRALAQQSWAQLSAEAFVPPFT